MTQTDTARGPLWGRTPASQQRRRDILLAGKKVFFESGYQLASVDRIAEVAGTTKRTVYNNFGSKERLLEAVIDHAILLFETAVPPLRPEADAGQISEERRLVVAAEVGGGQLLVAQIRHQARDVVDALVNGAHRGV